MDDLLERALTAKLREVADAVPDDIDPPADLELRVARRRKAKRMNSSSAFVLSMVAVLVAVVCTAGVVRLATNEPSPAARARLVDPLPAGTAMLAAQGRDVVALGSNGEQLATMIHAERGAVVDAQITRDHRWLWYLSVAGRAGEDCGEVVRADIVDRSSTVMAHAVSFGISPDARRLALSGYGDVAHGACEPGKHAAIATIDLWTKARARASVAGVDALRWSVDGRDLIGRQCLPASCKAVTFVQQAGVPRAGKPQIDAVAFAYDGSELLVVGPARHDVDVFQSSTTQFTFVRTALSSSSTIEHVLPTPGGLFVVAHAPGRSSRLFRTHDGVLTPISRGDPGAVSAVPPWKAAAR
jgi:hypothetical protein